MEDISAEHTELREAKAEAVVRVSRSDTIASLLQDRVPKGNMFEIAKVAGLFAVKNTHLSLPHSHLVPIEFTAVDFQIHGLEIHISVQVKSVCKSDLEMEAMHGASIVALTVYDMLKPIDKGICIEQIQIQGKAEKSERESSIQMSVKTAVVVCSDAVATGIKPDSAGQAVLKKLRSQPVQITSYILIPDSLEEIRGLAKRLSSENQLVIFSGGTGLFSTDVTPEALESLLERRIPGVEEAMRSYGQSRTPYAMFSRSLAGMIGDCVILALPGSTQGAMESMEAIFPHILHAFKL